MHSTQHCYFWALFSHNHGMWLPCRHCNGSCLRFATQLVSFHLFCSGALSVCRMHSTQHCFFSDSFFAQPRHVTALQWLQRFFSTLCKLVFLGTEGQPLTTSICQCWCEEWLALHWHKQVIISSKRKNRPTWNGKGPLSFGRIFLLQFSVNFACGSLEASELFAFVSIPSSGFIALVCSILEDKSRIDRRYHEEVVLDRHNLHNFWVSGWI